MIHIQKWILVSSLVTSWPYFTQSKRRARTNRRKRNARNQITKLLLSRQNDCILKCNPNAMAENEMCITQCMSTSCHDTVYRLHEKQLLEAGEFDQLRAIAFHECVKDELLSAT
jgi:hypothetical protein